MEFLYALRHLRQISILRSCAAMLFSVLILSASAAPIASAAEEYAKLAPYAGIRWEGHQPVVKIGEEWVKLISLNGVASADIVAFSRRTYDELWQKRFEEDLVEVLTRMGHEPQGAVRLVVLPLGSSKDRTLEGVPMTAGNRSAIKAARLPVQAAAPASERGGPQQATRSAVSIDDAATFHARVDEFLNALQAKAHFSGAVVVARDGIPVYQKALGVSHVASKTPNTVATPFRIASLSKQFTAAAIFRLEVQGKLSIDDPVHKHLSEFDKAPYREITIHHLLTHTSGLPRTPEGLVGSMRWSLMSEAATPVDDYVRLAVQMPLKFEPGTAHEYSNFGYRVLAALIERVTGREYADFMEQDVFGPLGMKNTGVARVTRPDSESRVAEGLKFVKLDDAGQAVFANGEAGRNFGTGYGSGGIYASANDLVRWDRTLAGDEFLNQEQKARLFRPVHDDYACGWIVKKSGLDGRVYQMHNGANDGFFSLMMRVPEDELVIIAVGNVDASPELGEALTQLFRLCRSLPYRDP